MMCLLAERGRALLLAAAVACGGSPAPQSQAAVVPATVSERMLAMLPQGAQVVVELDLARLRANPVVGSLVTRALADRTADLPAGLPAPPLAVANQLVLAAYGVGTEQAATLTLLAAPREPPGATKIADGFYAVGPPEWVEQTQQRVALAAAGGTAPPIAAPAELLALRKHAMPDGAPGASLRITARLPFDARIALARQTGMDAPPAQVSAWADVVDDLAMVIDCDASDPGDRPDEADPASAHRTNDAAKRLSGALRGIFATIADQPLVHTLGLPTSLANAKLISRGSWVRAVIAIGPSHLRRIVERASALLPPAPAAPASPAPASPAPAKSE